MENAPEELSMKILLLTRIAIHTLALLFVHIAFGGEPPISLDEISKILGYPANKLSVSDVTEQANKQALRDGLPTYISGHTYTGDYASFGNVSIGFAKEGTLLTEEQKLKMNKAIKKMAEMTGTNLVFKWLNFEDVGYGVAGFFALGAGGSDQRTIMTLYGKSDVVINLSLGEVPLEVLPGAEKYNELVKGGGIQDKLIEVLTLIASKSAGRPITVTAGTEMPVRPPSLPSTTNAAHTVPKVEPVAPEPSVTNQPVQKASQSFVEPQSAAPATPANPVSSMKNIFIVLAVLLVLAAGWILFRAKK